MTTFRTRTFIVISLIIFVILAISIVLYVVGKNNNNKPDTIIKDTETTVQIDSTNFDEAIQQTATDIPKGVTVKQPTTEEMLRNSVIQLSKIFTERYGTYSSDSNYANIREVKSIITQELWEEISQILDTPPPDDFIGVTTKAISSKIVEFDDNTALLKLSTKKIITDSTGDVENKIVDANVWIIRSGENWLVEKIEWKD